MSVYTEKKSYLKDSFSLLLLLYTVLVSIILILYYVLGEVRIKSFISLDMLYSRFLALAIITITAITSLSLIILSKVKVRHEFSSRLIVYGILLAVFAHVNSIISVLFRYNEILSLLTITFPFIFGCLCVLVGFSSWFVFQLNLNEAVRHVAKSFIVAVPVSLLIVLLVFNIGGTPYFDYEVEASMLPYCFSLMLVSITSLIFHSTLRIVDKFIHFLRIVIIMLSLCFLFASITDILSYIYRDVYIFEYTASTLYIAGFILFSSVLPLSIFYIIERRLPVIRKLSVTTKGPKMLDHGRSILLEYMLSEAHIDKVASIIRKLIEPYDVIVLVSHKASPILRNLLNTIGKSKKCVTVLYDSRTMYPREVAKDTYASMLDPTHIISIISKLKNKYYDKNIAIVYDNLTDSIITCNFKATYLMAKDILSSLNSRDTAIFLFVKGSLNERDYNTIKSLFEIVISVSA